MRTATVITFVIIFAVLFEPKTALACFGGPPCETYYEMLFTPNSFAIDSLTRIDSLFDPILLEIKKLPVFGWRDFDTGKWVDAKLRDCRAITIPETLYMFLLKEYRNELDSLEAFKKYKEYGKNGVFPTNYVLLIGETSSKLNSMLFFVKKNVINKNKPLDITDRFSDSDGYRFVEELACSIRASIEQEPNDEYTLVLNNTPYKMVKLSDSHYVVRLEKEKIEKKRIVK